MSNPERFDGRAGVYAAARPGYPLALLDFLRGEADLERVADLGAGTGLFTELLLQGARHVTAIEPNAGMREALQARLWAAQERGQLEVRDGTAERTTLPGHAMTLLSAAQAAHWFAPAPTLAEFRRILRPGGRVLFVWNDWRGSTHPFNLAYGHTINRFYREGDQPEQINRVPHDEIPAFMPGGHLYRTFENPLPLSLERLQALAGSVSYLPGPTDPEYPAMSAALHDLFHEYAEGGRVTLEYVAHSFLGEC